MNKENQPLPFPVYECHFILASDVFQGYQQVLELISWFIRRDANRTLILAEDVRRCLENYLDDEPDDLEVYAKLEEFLDSVFSLVPDNMYISFLDFEN